ncbi:MAG: hypothetical protein MI866_07120 [Bacteroidales bacterium]|nr:hypothetical protein [Bacteroidales bacterium]
MDSFIGFWLIVILGLILVLGGLIFLAYRIPKRIGKRKIGIVLSIILTSIILIPILTFVFEDYLFFKSDAIKSLEEHKITLLDDFKLESNEMSGIRDFYHHFELQISKADKDRLIYKILESEYYLGSISETFDIRTGKPRYSAEDQAFVVTYQNRLSYVYEYYKPNKSGYTPTWDIISISKHKNELTYERVLD